jgi:hypothetical protein
MFLHRILRYIAARWRFTTDTRVKMVKIPSPEQICGYTAIEREAADSFVTTVLKAVNKNLTNPRWVRNMKIGGEENPHWKILAWGEATESDKDEIRKALNDAGWTRIEMHNSSEIGKLPGTFRLTLYAKRIS